ncbi:MULTISPECIES: hypothetical protein [Nostoc]|uniref:Histidine kinase n=1 Tax=Nostoc paludosum FACHB-159 TaxID=2692908 RepID=A0ABR8KC04_9NOSO|nr:MULTISPECIES: hypothetical protein [Nostoc]MBD2680064.1 hypothetical protein [Nostoc sp. FACHB-857]MBD2736321.1 hypothetical protein [Nostoc paludosum FACHB-159]
MGRLVLSGAVGAASRREVWGDAGTRGRGEKIMTNDQCPMPNAQCPMPNTQYPMPN